MPSLPTNNSFHQFAPSDEQVLPHTLIKSFQMETLTLAQGNRGEGACYLVGPLACPELEIQPGPGVFAGARSPLPAAGGLEAVGGRPSQRRCPGKEGEAGASEERGARRWGPNQGKRLEYLGSGGLSQHSAVVPPGE